MQTAEEMQSQVVQALERFNELVSTRNLQVLEAFFNRVFARETTFSWEWERIDVSHAGDLAWFFAEGRVVLSTPQEQRRSPYRISGVLERRGARWLWRQYHGSEPVLSG